MKEMPGSRIVHLHSVLSEEQQHLYSVSEATSRLFILLGLKSTLSHPLAVINMQKSLASKDAKFRVKIFGLNNTNNTLMSSASNTEWT
jgi:flagellar biosynthesis/type III secretory pathway chaperone